MCVFFHRFVYRLIFQFVSFLSFVYRSYSLLIGIQLNGSFEIHIAIHLSPNDAKAISSGFICSVNDLTQWQAFLYFDTVSARKNFALISSLLWSQFGKIECAYKWKDHTKPYWNDNLPFVQFIFEKRINDFKSYNANLPCQIPHLQVHSPNGSVGHR